MSVIKFTSSDSSSGSSSEDSLLSWVGSLFGDGLSSLLMVLTWGYF